MNKEELHRALTAYLPEEVEWKKKYLKSLADGELPACMVNDPMKILSDDSDERDTSLDYGTHYFEGLRNIASASSLAIFYGIISRSSVC